MTIIRTAEPFGTFRMTAETIPNDGELGQFGYISSLPTWEDDYVHSDWDFRGIYDRFRGMYIVGDGANVPMFVTIYAESSAWLNSFCKGMMGEDDLTINYHIYRPGWISDASWIRVLKMLGWRR